MKRRNRRINILERVFASIEPQPTGCWFWTRSTNKGYGQVQCVDKITGKYYQVAAHRFVWEFTYRKQIPAGLDIDHTCRNRACVNPIHMEPVTRKVNVLRGEGLAAANARKTHCVNGHPFTDENTFISKAQWDGFATHRVCLTCRRERDRKRGWRRSPKRPS